MRNPEKSVERTTSRVLREYWRSLSGRERSRLLLLAFAVMVMAVLEVINVSAIMPFLTAAIDPGAMEEQRVLAFMHELLGFPPRESFLVVLGLMVFALMLVTNGWSALTTWMEARFVWSWNHTQSTRLLRRYLYQPYTYFMGRNSADLTKNVLSEVEQISAQLLVPAVDGIGRVVVALGIIGALLVAEPGMALLVTGVVGGVYSLIFVLSRRKLDRVGRERLEANEQRFRAASEVFGGIKDVKLLGLERAFLNRFRASSALFSRRRSTADILARVPRYAVEPIAFGTVVLLVVYLIAARGDVAQIVPMLGLYAFAGYRLMPAVQQAFQAVTRLRVYAPALEHLLRELGDADVQRIEVQGLDTRPKGEPLVPRDRLEFRQVTFSYPGSERPAVRDMSFVVPAKSTVGLVGATGSGKTTVADLLLGLLSPQSGEIVIDGVPLTEETLPRWRAAIGYVPQQIFLLDASVAENIAFGIPRDQIDMDAVRRAARIAMLDEFVMQELPNGYNTLVGERGIRLSGGQRQRIGIARALYRNPSFIVLDEATSALDNHTERLVMEALHNLLRDRTVVMIAHRLTTLRGCDIIYMLEAGRVVASGSFQELMSGRGRFAKLTVQG